MKTRRNLKKSEYKKELDLIRRLADNYIVKFDDRINESIKS